VEFVRNNIVLILIAFVSGGMLLWPGLRQGGKRVGTVEATRLINREEAVILDVRESAEFDAGHLPEARHLPLKELESRFSELASLKEKPLLVVCAAGARAGQACARLEKQGFTRLHVLEGGVDAWQRAGLPLIKEKRK
jgi:rhodanese-related sulfurtransferase